MALLLSADADPPRATRDAQLQAAYLDSNRTGNFWDDMAMIAGRWNPAATEGASQHQQGLSYLEENIKVYDARIAQVRSELHEYQFSKFDSRFNRRSADNVQREIQHLQAEQQTFILLHFLHESREAGAGASAGGRVSRFSEKERVQRLRADQTLRRYQGVVSWLEDMADVGNIQQRGSVEYRRTFQAMAQDENKRPPGLVEQLDPDVLFRHPDKNVHKEDLTDEAKLVNYVWRYVRAGKVAEAVRLCKTYKQAWRAATLKGGELWHDQQQEGSEVEGNRRRLLWKLACRKLAEMSPLPAEQAVYAVLGGDVAKVLASGCCTSWEDCCWAYFKTMLELLEDERLIDSRQLDGLQEHGSVFEANLQNELGCDVPFVGEQVAPLIAERRGLLPTSPQQQVTRTAEEVFAQLERRFTGTLTANDRYQHLQQQLILCREDALANKLRMACPFLKIDQAAPVDDRALMGEPEHASYTSFAVHLCIYFLAFTSWGDAHPIAADARAWDDRLLLFKLHLVYLIHKKQYDALLVYCKYLPEQLRIEQYGSFLSGLDEERRAEYIAKAGEAFSSEDVVKITAFLVKTALQSDQLSGPNGSPGASAAASQGAQSAAAKTDFVRSYMGAALKSQDGAAVADAFCKANALFRHFMLGDCVQEARLLREVLREEIGYGVVDPRANWGREYECWSQYIDCFYKLNEVGQANQNCVAPPARGGRAQTNLQSDILRAEAEAQELEHEQRQYAEACEVRANLLQHAYETAEDTLTFPLGWLTDVEPTSEVGRADELQALRRKCVPALISILLQTCELCGDLSRINSLACLVVQEPNDGSTPLYKALSTNEMKFILERIRKAHLQLS